MNDNDFKYSNITEVNKFTDLGIVDTEYARRFCECVDTLPCYMSDDKSLVIWASDDVLFDPHPEGFDPLNCWNFEWEVYETETGDWYDFICGHGYGSPWQAFREAMRKRDKFVADNS